MPVPQLLVEVERDIHRQGVLIHFGFSACGFQVVEDALFFDALQEMIRVVGVEWLAGLETPQLADHRLALDVQAGDVELAERKLWAGSDLECKIDSLLGVMYIAL